MAAESSAGALALYALREVLMRAARWFVVFVVAVGSGVACGPGGKPAPVVKEPIAAAPPPVQPAEPAEPAPPPEEQPEGALAGDMNAPEVEIKDLDSKDILARSQTPTTPVYVKHVLLGWKELAPSRHGSLDPGSATSGIPYEVTPEAGLVSPFKELSLRLKVSEVGVVKTEFGIHIIQRVE